MGKSDIMRLEIEICIIKKRRKGKNIGEAMTRMRGTQNNGGTSAHQQSESSDSSFTHNFRGGGCECKQTLCLRRRSRIEGFIPNDLLGVGLFIIYFTTRGHLSFYDISFNIRRRVTIFCMPF